MRYALHFPLMPRDTGLATSPMDLAALYVLPSTLRQLEHREHTVVARGFVVWELCNFPRVSLGPGVEQLAAITVEEEHAVVMRYGGQMPGHPLDACMMLREAKMQRALGIGWDADGREV